MKQGVTMTVTRNSVPSAGQLSASGEIPVQQGSSIPQTVERERNPDLLSGGGNAGQLSDRHRPELANYRTGVLAARARGNNR